MATKPQSKQTSKSKTPPAKAKAKMKAKAVVYANPSNTANRPKQDRSKDARPPSTKTKKNGEPKRAYSTSPLTTRNANAAGVVGRAAMMIEREAHKVTRRQLVLEELLKAQEGGDLPHVFLLKIMRGEALIHQAFDHDSGEIVDMVVLPTFQDRLDAAHKAAPYFSQKLPVAKDPNPQKDGGSGVMETPLVGSLDEWTKVAAVSQAQLKEDVVK